MFPARAPCPQREATAPASETWGQAGAASGKRQLEAEVGGSPRMCLSGFVSQPSAPQAPTLSLHTEDVEAQLGFQSWKARAAITCLFPAAKLGSRWFSWDLKSKTSSCRRPVSQIRHHPLGLTREALGMLRLVGNTGRAL